MDYAIELQNVCKNYDNFKLDHVTMNVPKGSVVGFVGENGAGKTTTIKAILNLITVDSGKIQVFGQDHVCLLYTSSEAAKETTMEEQFESYLRTL